jgi:beta-hydroxylase
MFYENISILIIILFITTEYDRQFSDTPNQPYFYYNSGTYKLGFFNTLVRLFHPSHTHVFNVENFEEHHIIKNGYDDIRKEALNINNNNKLLNMKDLYEDGFSAIDNVPNTWKVYVLKWYDKPLKNAQISCPKTVEILNKCKNIKAAMFSILEPGKYINPHRGPFTGCLRYHFGIKIPKDRENCWIQVNNEKFYWDEGEALIFDDTYTHSVYNNTNETRIILFIDIVRPLIFPFNKINDIIINSASAAEFIKNINDISETVNDIKPLE